MREDFQISEELFAMVNLKDRTQGSDLCDACLMPFTKVACNGLS